MSKPSSSHASHDVPLGLSLAALLLGSVALLLSFLPILSVPFGGIGLLLGALGLVVSLLERRRGLLWPIGGVVLPALGLAVGLALGNAPEGYMPNLAGAARFEPEPSPQPFVSPPARPRP